MLLSLLSTQKVNSKGWSEVMTGKYLYVCIYRLIYWVFEHLFWLKPSILNNNFKESGHH